MSPAANGERGLGPGAVRPVQTRFRRSLTARSGQTGHSRHAAHSQQQNQENILHPSLKNIVKTYSHSPNVVN